MRSDGPTIVYVTVCTRRRAPWLATEAVHEGLCEVWTEADAWMVGRYCILPDHVHLFAGPGAHDVPLDHWVQFWKSRFSKMALLGTGRWEPGQWDTRLRNGESYDEKWEYVRNNPVRHGLVTHADDWPFEGELNVLDWWVGHAK